MTSILHEGNGCGGGSPVMQYIYIMYVRKCECWQKILCQTEPLLSVNP